MTQEFQDELTFGEGYWSNTSLIGSDRPANSLIDGKNLGGYMFPVAPFKSFIQCGVTNFQHLCGGFLGHALSYQYASFFDNSLCELSPRAFFSFRKGVRLGMAALSSTCCGTPFLLTIYPIIFLCAKKQMMRVAAKRNITFMTYKQIARLFLVVQEICYPVCRKFLLLVDLYVSISRSRKFTLPKPAFIYATLIYQSPKLFYNWLFVITNFFIFCSNHTISMKAIYLIDNMANRQGCQV